MTQDRTLSIIASIVGAGAAIWYFHDVAMVTRSHGEIHFPFVPALVAVTAIVLALYLGTRGRPED